MLLSPILTVAALAAPLPQTDRFVDPVHGSDLATGTSIATAWKTVTRGLGLVAPGTTIKVLPGTLDVASGEGFPIQMPRGVSIESTDGPDATRIVSDVLALTLERDSRVEGFEIRSQANIAILGFSWFQAPVPPRAQVNHCRVFAPNGAGVDARLGLEMRGTRVEARGLGVNIQRGEFRAWDCQISGGETSGWALQLVPSGPASDEFHMERCVVTSPGGCAAILGGRSSNQPMHFSFLNCEIRDCADGGIVFAAVNDRDVVLDVAGCTVANNGPQGIGIFTTGGETLDFDLRSSIVAGHTTGDVLAPATATNSLVQDGSATGPGCLTGDPRFVDAPGGDLRLRFDSPCKDNGVIAGEGLDVTGRARTIDGDLDLIQAPDMGAIEHRTLTAPASVPLGDPLTLGMTGPANGFSFLVMDLNGLQSTPLSTPFGRLLVYGPTAMRLAPVVTTGGGPTLQTLPAFTNPALVGESVGFQALTRSTAAPAFAAFSNSAAVEIQ